MKKTVLNSPSSTLKDPIVKLDDQFSVINLQIEKYSCILDKSKRSKVDQWAKKLGQASTNVDFKRDRNLYSMLLLDSILSLNLVEPFDKNPPEGPLPTLNKNLVKFRLADLHKKLQGSGINSDTLGKTKPNVGQTTPTANNYTNKKRIKTRENASQSLLDIKMRLSTMTSPKKDVKLYTPIKSRPLTSDDLDTSQNICSTKETETYAVLNTEPNEKQEFSALLEDGKNELHPPNTIESLNLLKPYHVVHSKEVKEILRLRVEIELLKVSEEALKSELNQKILQHNSSLRENEGLRAQVSKLMERNTLMTNFFQFVKKKIEYGAVRFNDFTNAETTLREINKLCAHLSIPPIIKTPKLIDKGYSVERPSTETTHLDNSHSFTINDQTRIKLDMSMSPLKYDHEFNESENFTLKCSIDLEKDILNPSVKIYQPTLRTEELTSSPVAIDTFRYKLEGSRKDHFIDANIRRESAAFLGEEESSEQTVMLRKEENLV